MIVSYGHTYPLTARWHPTFNSPVIELVFQMYSVKKRPISLVDVGANIGDTILLLESNCPGMIDEFYCVEGEPGFFALLQNNLNHLKQGKLLCALVSCINGTERSLVRHHSATASAQGKREIPSATLDALLERASVSRVDVLKIDVDGLDGKVLLGARGILQRHRPAVIFEWHPILCRNTSSSWMDHFDTLEECRYTRFIWFTKYGNFSHYTATDDRRSIGMLAEVCLRNRAYDDWHYDVIALPQESAVSHVALAELRHGKARKSSY